MNKLFKNLKSYKMSVAGILILVFIQSMTELYLPTLMGDIINEGVVKQDTAYIWRVGFYMVLITGLGTICSIIASYLGAKTGSGFGRD